MLWDVLYIMVLCNYNGISPRPPSSFPDHVVLPAFDYFDDETPLIGLCAAVAGMVIATVSLFCCCG